MIFATAVASTLVQVDFELKDQRAHDLAAVANKNRRMAIDIMHRQLRGQNPFQVLDNVMKKVVWHSKTSANGVIQRRVIKDLMALRRESESSMKALSAEYVAALTKLVALIPTLTLIKEDIAADSKILPQEKVDFDQIVKKVRDTGLVADIIEFLTEHAPKIKDYSYEVEKERSRPITDFPMRSYYHGYRSLYHKLYDLEEIAIKTGKLGLIEDLATAQRTYNATTREKVAALLSQEHNTNKDELQKALARKVKIAEDIETISSLKSILSDLEEKRQVVRDRYKNSMNEQLAALPIGLKKEYMDLRNELKFDAINLKKLANKMKNWILKDTTGLKEDKKMKENVKARLVDTINNFSDSLQNRVLNPWSKRLIGVDTNPLILPTKLDMVAFNSVTPKNEAEKLETKIGVKSFTITFPSKGASKTKQLTVAGGECSLFVANFLPVVSIHKLNVFNVEKKPDLDDDISSALHYPFTKHEIKLGEKSITAFIEVRNKQFSDMVNLYWSATNTRTTNCSIGLLGSDKVYIKLDVWGDIDKEKAEKMKQMEQLEEEEQVDEVDEEDIEEQVDQVVEEGAEDQADLLQEGHTMVHAELQRLI